jgi:DNA invertase Pin-like site-specific DNA recombinase
MIAKDTDHGNQRLSAKPQVKAAYRRGHAGRVIGHAKDAIKPGTRVLIGCRVSHRNYQSNLKDQEACLRRGYPQATVVGVVAEVWSAIDNTGFVEWLVARARELKADVILVESTDRLIRNSNFIATENDLQASEVELDWLAVALDGMMAVTHVDPDATSEVRRQRSDRGQQAKGNKGGRPRRGRYSKPLRDDLLPRVTDLVEKGMSKRAIARELGVGESTIRVWLQTCAPSSC